MGPGPSLSEAASAALSEDWQTLSSLAFHHRSGVHVFPEPDDLLEAERVTPEEVGGLLRGLTGLYDFVIRDGPQAVNPQTVRILDEAHRDFLLTTPTVPALRNAVRRLDVFQQLGVAKEKIDLIVAEVSPVLEISPAQCKEVLGREVRANLPHDPKAVVGALNRGQPILERHPKSPYIRSLREIASSLAERRPGQAEDPRDAASTEGRAK
jgi:pilus assembly protein CpaE